MLQFLFVLIPLFLTNGCRADGGNVYIQFDFVQESLWNSVVHDTFASLIANFTNSYCKTNYTACAMNTYSLFSCENIKLIPGYPKFFDLYATLLFHVVLPMSNATRLPSSTLTDIVATNQLKIWKTLQALSGGIDIYAYRISHINSVLIRPPYDETLNKIIIPFTLAVLFVLAVFIAGCEISRSLHKRAELKAIQKRILEKKTTTERNGSSELFQAKNENQELSV